MLRLSLSYLKKNKKQTFTMMIGIVIASVLLFSVGILFSSFREFLILEVSNSNDYHVKITGDLDGFSSDSIDSLKYKDDEYDIKFENIYDTYEKTEEICEKRTCEKIVYNTKLLSLYGIGDNNYLSLFKSLLFTIVLILSISVFFIIYNSFQISLTKKRRDIALMKAIGVSNGQLYKVFLLEGVICGVLGLIFGFCLSLAFNIGVINLINEFFQEFFDGKMHLCLYASFIIIPLFFMILIILFSSLIPLFKIKKCKVMELFRENNSLEKGSHVFNNFVLNYAYTNYKRNTKRYRSLIICVFILMVLFNSFVNLTNYTLKILDEYIDIPNYDLKVVTNTSDYKKLDGLSKRLAPNEEIIYRSCTKQASIPKEKYLNGFQNNVEVLITDLGGNEVVNLVNDTLVEDNKMSKVSYEVFDNLNEITFDNGGKVEDIKLTDKVPFGFDNLLTKGRVILNLDSDKFDMICPVFEGNLNVKTDKSGLDDLTVKYALKEDFGDFTYINVKKAYELINNFVLVIKIFMFLCIGLVILISMFTIFNIVSANIKLRKREFASLKAIGLTNFKISLCLLFECFIISGKGTLYSFPFVLMISRSLYKNLGVYFDIGMNIFDYKIFLISFTMCFLLIFVCMFISHLHLYKDSLISNIKCENI